MKKILALIMTAALCAAALSGCSNAVSKQSVDAIKKAGKITMATNAEFPPFEYLENDKVVGVDADIAAEIAKDLGVELEIVDGKFDAVIPSVQSGKASFGAAGMTVTEDRAKKVDFSVKYITSTQYIIVPKDSDVKTIEDLAGKKIGVQLGTTGDFIISDEVDGYKDDDGNPVKGVLQDTGATITRANNAIDATQDMVNGKLDAVVIDKLPAENIAATQATTKTFELVYSDGSNTEEQYAIAVAKGNETLLEAINKTLQRLMDEGKIDEFVVNHSK